MKPSIHIYQKTPDYTDLCIAPANQDGTLRKILEERFGPNGYSWYRDDETDRIIFRVRVNVCPFDILKEILEAANAEVIDDKKCE